MQGYDCFTMWQDHGGSGGVMGFVRDCVTCRVRVSKGCDRGCWVCDEELNRQAVVADIESRAPPDFPSTPSSDDDSYSGAVSQDATGAESRLAQRVLMAAGHHGSGVSGDIQAANAVSAGFTPWFVPRRGVELTGPSLSEEFSEFG
eukprot:Hpha_TRINITY_DN16552_c2_g4::TRINITY_DN16552_c2_g4_i4::g.132566::m.132566